MSIKGLKMLSLHVRIMLTEEFVTFCREDLRLPFQRLESERLNSRADYKGFALMVAIAGIALTLLEVYFGVFDFLKINRLIMPALAGFVILGGMPVLYYRQFRRFQKVKETFERELFPRLLEAALPEWAWVPAAPTSATMVKGLPYKFTQIILSYEGTGPMGPISFRTLAIKGGAGLASALSITVEHPWGVQKPFTLSANYDMVANGATAPAEVFSNYFGNNDPVDAMKIPEMVKLAMLNFTMDLELRHYGPAYWQVSEDRITLIITFQDECFLPSLQNSLLANAFYHEIFDRLNIIEAFRGSLLLQEPSASSFVDK